VESAVAYVFARGGEGGLELAEKLCSLIEREKPDFKPLYDINLPVTEKIGLICSKIYGARAVEYKDRALKEIKTIEDLGMGSLPICMAKTQFSLSDDPTLHGVPSDFVITVKEVRLSAGAGFIVALTGDIMTMPGLPRDPAARRMDIDSEGVITGLF
jgi:formate--tetrahydrofolate ligase